METDLIDTPEKHFITQVLFDKKLENERIGNLTTNDCRLLFSAAILSILTFKPDAQIYPEKK